MPCLPSTMIPRTTRKQTTAPNDSNAQTLKSSFSVVDSSSTRFSFWLCVLDFFFFFGFPPAMFPFRLSARSFPLLPRRGRWRRMAPPDPLAVSPDATRFRQAACPPILTIGVVVHAWIGALSRNGQKNWIFHLSWWIFQRRQSWSRENDINPWNGTNDRPGWFECITEDRMNRMNQSFPSNLRLWQSGHLSLNIYIVSEQRNKLRSFSMTLCFSTCTALEPLIIILLKFLRLFLFDSA